jgi:two-component system, OmpR family, sensor histidine kinase BaeS
VLQVNTEALLDGIVAHTPEQTASLHEEVLRLSRMVDDLQTLAAVEAAALRLSLQPCDLALIAGAAAEDWEAGFAAARVSFERRLEPAPVEADPGGLHQVITNLPSNALKFTPPGGRVQMTLARVGQKARLEVIDTGPRIRPEDQPPRFRSILAQCPGRPHSRQRHRARRLRRACPRTAWNHRGQQRTRPRITVYPDPAPGTRNRNLENCRGSGISKHAARARG